MYAQKGFILYKPKQYQLPNAGTGLKVLSLMIKFFGSKLCVGWFAKLTLLNRDIVIINNTKRQTLNWLGLIIMVNEEEKMEHLQWKKHVNVACDSKLNDLWILYTNYYLKVLSIMNQFCGSL